MFNINNLTVKMSHKMTSNIYNTVYPQIINFVNTKQPDDYLIISNKLDFCPLLNNFPFLNNSCFISGGLLASLASIPDITTINTDPILMKSDIDIYILGTKEEKQQCVNNIIKYLNRNSAKQKPSSQIKIIGATSSVIYIITDYEPRIYQLILMAETYTTPQSVIEEFDLDYVKMFYTGSKLYIHSSAAHALCTKETNYSIGHKTNINNILFRYAKALARGYKISNESCMRIPITLLNGGKNIPDYDCIMNILELNDDENTYRIKHNITIGDLLKCSNINKFMTTNYEPWNTITSKPEYILPNNKINISAILNYYQREYSMSTVSYGVKQINNILTTLKTNKTQNTKTRNENRGLRLKINWDGLTQTSYYSGDKTSRAKYIDADEVTVQHSVIGTEYPFTNIPSTLNSNPTPGGRRIDVTPVPLHWDYNPVHTVYRKQKPYEFVNKYMIIPYVAKNIILTGFITRSKNGLYLVMSENSQAFCNKLYHSITYGKYTAPDYDYRKNNFVERNNAIHLSTYNDFSKTKPNVLNFYNNIKTNNLVKICCDIKIIIVAYIDEYDSVMEKLQAIENKTKKTPPKLLEHLHTSYIHKTHKRFILNTSKPIKYITDTTFKLCNPNQMQLNRISTLNNILYNDIYKIYDLTDSHKMLPTNINKLPDSEDDLLDWIKNYGYVYSTTYTEYFMRYERQGICNNEDDINSVQPVNNMEYTECHIPVEDIEFIIEFKEVPSLIKNNIKEHIHTTFIVKTGMHKSYDKTYRTSILEKYVDSDSDAVVGIYGELTDSTYYNMQRIVKALKPYGYGTELFDTMYSAYNLNNCNNKGPNNIFIKLDLLDIRYEVNYEKQLFDIFRQKKFCVKLKMQPLYIQERYYERKLTPCKVTIPIMVIDKTTLEHNSFNEVVFCDKITYSPEQIQFLIANNIGSLVYHTQYKAPQVNTTAEYISNNLLLLIYDIVCKSKCSSDIYIYIEETTKFLNRYGETYNAYFKYGKSKTYYIIEEYSRYIREVVIKEKKSGHSIPIIPISILGNDINNYYTYINDNTNDLLYDYLPTELIQIVNKYNKLSGMICVYVNRKQIHTPLWMMIQSTTIKPSNYHEMPVTPPRKKMHI